METLNEARLSIVLHQYLLDGQLLSPVEANQKEPVFLCMALKPNLLQLIGFIMHLINKLLFLLAALGRTVPIKFGVRLGDIVQESVYLLLCSLTYYTYIVVKKKNCIDC